SFNGTPAPDADVKTLAEGLFAAAPDAAKLMTTEIGARKTELCPVVAAMLSDSLAGLVSNQANLHTFYHPYLKAAQVLSGLHGCGPSEADGAFGPGSRSAWKALAAHLQMPQPHGQVPSPGDVAIVAAKPTSVGACDSGEDGAGTAVSALDALALAGAEESW